MGAAVRLRLDPLHQLALFEAVEQMHQPGALDAEPLRHRHLGQARIGADDRQHGILRRLDIDLAERLDEVLKDPDLEAPHRITGVPDQRVEADLVRVVRPRRAVAGTFAWGGAGLSSGCAGCHVISPAEQP